MSLLLFYVLVRHHIAAVNITVTHCSVHAQRKRCVVFMDGCCPLISVLSLLNLGILLSVVPQIKMLRSVH